MVRQGTLALVTLLPMKLTLSASLYPKSKEPPGGGDGGGWDRGGGGSRRGWWVGEWVGGWDRGGGGG